MMSWCEKSGKVYTILKSLRIFTHLISILRATHKNCRNYPYCFFYNIIIIVMFSWWIPFNRRHIHISSEWSCAEVSGARRDDYISKAKQTSSNRIMAWKVIRQLVGGYRAQRPNLLRSSSACIHRSQHLNMSLCQVGQLQYEWKAFPSHELFFTSFQILRISYRVSLFDYRLSYATQ